MILNEEVSDELETGAVCGRITTVMVFSSLGNCHIVVLHTLDNSHLNK